MVHHTSFLGSLLISILLHQVLTIAAQLPHRSDTLSTVSKTRQDVDRAADRVADKAVEEAEKAYKSAAKAAAQAEKAFKSATNAVAAAEEVQGVVDKAASWEDIKDPKDMFSTFSKSFMKIIMKRYTPAELVEFIRRIARKIYAGKELSTLEEKAWKSASKALKEELTTPNCNIFFSGKIRSWATCCRILAASQYFGFCTLLSVLHISESRRLALLEKKTKIKNDAQTRKEEKKSGQRTDFTQRDVEVEESNILNTAIHGKELFAENFSYRWYSSFAMDSDLIYQDASVYVDLFSVACYPPLDLGLCSQFCCDGDNRDGVFCNSELECY